MASSFHPALLSTLNNVFSEGYQTYIHSIAKENNTNKVIRYSYTVSAHTLLQLRQDELRGERLILEQTHGRTAIDM